MARDSRLTFGVPLPVRRSQLPGQVDVLLSEDEPLIRPNIGRHVRPRMEPDQLSSDAENVLSATVPASSGLVQPQV